MEPDFVNLLTELVNLGIEPTLMQKHGVIYADLNAETKSGMYLHQDMTVTGRYDENDTVENMNDLVCIFVSRFHAKDFGNETWLDLAVKMGYLTKHVETKVTYK
jgi:hypothetical protein